MSRRRKIILLVLLVIAVSVPSILVYASETQTFLFSADLHVEDFVAEGDSYVTNVTDSGILVAHIYFQLEHPMPNSTSNHLRFSIWHTDDTELDSMNLQFSTEPYVIGLYLEAPSYFWPAAQFSRDNNVIVFSVKDLGWYGTGTITLGFILVSDPQAVNLSFTADIAMHKSAFLQLTSLKASAHLVTPIPG